MRTTTRSAGTALAPVLVITVLLMTGLLATGCGTAHHARPVRATTTSAGIVTRTQAARLARALLSDVRLPGSAQRLTGRPPQPLTRPPGISTGTPSVLASRLWTDPVPVGWVVAFIRAHPPAGMRADGSGQGSAGGRYEFLSYTLARPPAGISSDLLTLTVAQRGKDTSVIRADAQVIWYPPRSAAELIPAGTRAVTISASLLSPFPRSASRTFTSPAVVGRLVAMLNGAQAAPGGVISCPMLTSTYRLAFAAAPGAAPYLVATASGCGTVQITVDGRPQPALKQPPGLLPCAASLLHLTPPPPGFVKVRFALMPGSP